MLFFTVFFAIEAPFANQTVLPCPGGTFLLSCGIKNSQTTNPDTFRSAFPNGTNACNCFNYYDAICVAWCTTFPVSQFETVNVQGTGIFSANCSTGKQVL